MIHLSNIALRRGRQVLIEGAGLQVHAGQRLGLIGANGCGKSSLFAMLLGQLEPEEGELSVDDHAVIAHVAQESPTGTQSAVNYVMSGDQELVQIQQQLELANHTDSSIHHLHERMETIDGYTAQSRAARLLHGLGFSAGEFEQSVSDFSGGWRMRLNLARALMCRSDILLLDEPTNHLDLPAVLWLERWLKGYEGILLIVSHDRDFLDQVCTRIAHIEHCKMNLYTGNYSQFEAQRAEHLAQQQALFVRQQKDIKHIQSYVDRFRYKASKARQAQSRLKMLERMEKITPAHADSPFRFDFPEPAKQPQHLLGLTEAKVGYGEVTVLDKVELHLSAGDRVGLLGVNGAGKSTLVKALSTGSTLLSGERTLSKDTQIGYFAQHQLELLDPTMSPYDHLAQIVPNAKEQEQRNYLGSFGFSGERIFEPVAPFSGGEKARLVLALMIRQGPNLLLLDEPTNHLDLEMRQALSVALIKYTGALVVISHDRHLLRSVCDELMIVHDGMLDRFAESIDDYPRWLRDREQSHEEAAKKWQPQVTTLSKKELRQEQALRRQREKPLRDKVKKIELQLSKVQKKQALYEAQLADEAIYSDPERKAELKKIILDQATIASEIEALEWEWLAASDELENAQ